MGANRCWGQVFEWPKPIPLDSGAEIEVFKPEIIRYDRTVVQFKSVFSVIGSDPDRRLFGMAWVTARVAVDSVNGRLPVNAYTVDHVRIPDDSDAADVRLIWELLKVNLRYVIKELPMAEAKEAERERIAAEAGGGQGGSA